MAVRRLSKIILSEEEFQSFEEVIEDNYDKFVGDGAFIIKPPDVLTHKYGPEVLSRRIKMKTQSKTPFQKDLYCYHSSDSKSGTIADFWRQENPNHFAGISRTKDMMEIFYNQLLPDPAFTAPYSDGNIGTLFPGKTFLYLTKVIAC